MMMNYARPCKSHFPAFDHFNNITLAALTGWIAWPGNFLFFSILAPAIILNSQTRIIVFLSAMTYYLAASCGLPHGAEVFFSHASWIQGYGLWLSCGILNALPWAVFWRKSSSHILTASISLILLALPPLGVLGWASPLTAAGWIFPGMGIAGLVLTLILILLIVLRYWAFIIVMLVVSFFMNSTYQLPIKQGVAIQTHFNGMASGSLNFSSQYWRNQAAIIMAKKAIESQGSHNVIVLPETTVGTWSVSRRIMWEPVAKMAAAKKDIVAIGAERLRPVAGYDNDMVLMGGKDYRFFPQRVPVPVSMWHPWSKGGASSNWFGKGIAQYRHHKIGYLVCYEQILVWPAVITGINNPGIVVGMANDWWARHTSFPSIQAMAFHAWGRLFNWESVESRNE
ncbi:MAG: hypothetical protein KGI54_05995 [Pseudomonadota bacterium]|nr:hypothetical protein [Pseudomonadota bacterium]